MNTVPITDLCEKKFGKQDFKVTARYENSKKNLIEANMSHNFTESFKTIKENTKIDKFTNPSLKYSIKQRKHVGGEVVVYSCKTERNTFKSITKKFKVHVSKKLRGRKLVDVVCGYGKSWVLLEDGSVMDFDVGGITASSFIQSVTYSSEISCDKAVQRQFDLKNVKEIRYENNKNLVPDHDLLLSAAQEAGLRFSYISLGKDFAAGVGIDDQVLYTWGVGSQGQLGLGHTRGSLNPTPVRSMPHEKIKQVECGEAHLVILSHEGHVFTCGRGLEGQLGQTSGNDLEQLGRMGMAIRKNGYDDGKAPRIYGIAPQNLVKLSPKFVQKLWRVKVEKVSCGARFTAALSEDGAVWTWGEGLMGQLGDGRSTRRVSPSRVFGPHMNLATSSTATQDCHTAGMEEYKEFMITNKHHSGSTNDEINEEDIHVEQNQTTVGPGSAASPSPWNSSKKVEEKGQQKHWVVDIACGIGHVLALDMWGHLAVWGFNQFGQLGLGDTTSRFYPEILYLPRNEQRDRKDHYHASRDDSTSREPSSLLVTPKDYSHGKNQVDEEREGKKSPSSDTGASMITDSEGDDKVRKQISAGDYSSGCIDEFGQAWQWGTRLYSNEKQDKAPCQLVGYYKEGRQECAQEDVSENGNCKTWDGSKKGMVKAVSGSSLCHHPSSSSSTVTSATNNYVVPTLVAPLSGKLTSHLGLSSHQLIAVTPTEITGLSPTTGGLTGGTRIFISGTGLWPDDRLVVRFTPVMLDSHEEEEWEEKEDSSSNSSVISNYSSGNEQLMQDSTISTKKKVKKKEGNSNNQSTTHNNKIDSDMLLLEEATEAAGGESDGDSTCSSSSNFDPRTVSVVEGTFDETLGQVVCIAPPFPCAGEVKVDLSIDGNLFTSTKLSYFYFQLPVVTSVFPTWIPYGVESKFTVSGTDFKPSDSLKVRLRTYSLEEDFMEKDNTSDTRKKEEDVTSRDLKRTSILTTRRYLKEFILVGVYVDVTTSEEKETTTSDSKNKPTSTTTAASLTRSMSKRQLKEKQNRQRSATRRKVDHVLPVIEFTVPSDLQLRDPTTGGPSHLHPLRFEVDIALNGVDFTASCSNNHDISVLVSDLQICHFTPMASPCTVPVGDTRETCLYGTGMVLTDSTSTSSNAQLCVRFVMKVPSEPSSSSGKGGEQGLLGRNKSRKTLMNKKRENKPPLLVRKVKAFTVKAKRKQYKPGSSGPQQALLYDQLAPSEQAYITCQIPKPGANLFSSIIGTSNGNGNTRSGKITAALEISLNGGEHWVRGKELFTFYLAEICSLSPSCGPVKGGNVVRLRITEEASLPRPPQKVDYGDSSSALTAECLHQIGHQPKVKLITDASSSTSTMIVPGSIQGSYVNFTMPLLSKAFPSRSTSRKVSTTTTTRVENTDDTATTSGSPGKDHEKSSKVGVEEENHPPSSIIKNPVGAVKIRVTLNGLDYSSKSVKYVCYEEPLLHSVVPHEVVLLSRPLPPEGEVSTITTVTSNNNKSSHSDIKSHILTEGGEDIIVEERARVPKRTNFCITTTGVYYDNADSVMRVRMVEISQQQQESHENATVVQEVAEQTVVDQCYVTDKVRYDANTGELHFQGPDETTMLHPCSMKVQFAMNGESFPLLDSCDDDASPPLIVRYISSIEAAANSSTEALTHRRKTKKVKNT